MLVLGIVCLLYGLDILDNIDNLACQDMLEGNAAYNTSNTLHENKVHQTYYFKTYYIIDHSIHPIYMVLSIIYVRCPIHCPCHSVMNIQPAKTCAWCPVTKKSSQHMGTHI